ncbi:phage major capsid protein [Rhodococcus sp. 1R11]|uniref:phage major capsid protein n=1 Tax=Rhodococcus sp. 1R11 TaxID=2559614 RepID=UPI00107268AD|nr:phage major capsid protein [Rhodococcus sp. 1R11]TFI45155.1 phage major capsid protein [Rhodococcus sp. 1R11]
MARRRKNAADTAADRRESRDDLIAELEELRDTGDLSDPETAERFDEITEQVEDIDARAAAVKAQLASGERSSEHGSNVGATQDRRTVNASPTRDQIMRTLESDVKAKLFTADAADTVEKLIGAEGSKETRYLQAVGNPEYRTAFEKLLGDPENGHRLFTGSELSAFQTAQATSRALNEGTPASGGYAVPLVLDPQIVLTSGGSVNPIREIAKNVTITGQAYRGLSSAGATAEWTPEATEMADASPTIANPVIPVHKADAFVPWSFEVEGDAPQLLSEVRTLLVDSLEQLTAQAFTHGSGVGQPKGIVTALAAAGAPYVLNPGAAETLTAADVYNLQGSLPPRFQPNARWVANLSIINLLRQHESGNGSPKFPEINTGQLLSRPLQELSNLDSFNPAVTDAANLILIYGSWDNYVVVNRLGTTLELVPQLFGANRRPTGQRGMILWARYGGDLVNPNGFRALNVATAA